MIVQNSDPFTYFRKRPIRVAEPAGLNTGTLSLAVLEAATPLELPTLSPASCRAGPLGDGRHRQVEILPELAAARVEAIDDRRSRSRWTATSHRRVLRGGVRA